MLRGKLKNNGTKDYDPSHFLPLPLKLVDPFQVSFAKPLQPLQLVKLRKKGSVR